MTDYYAFAEYGESNLTTTMQNLSDDLPKKAYRIDFALIILTGNITRYLITRPVVEEDREVTSLWYPIRTWYAEDPLGRFPFMPASVRVRLRHFLDTWRLYVREPADAIVIHAFETYYLYTLYKRLMGRKTIVVFNPDGIVPLGSNWLSRHLYRYAVSNTQIFIPWSQWAAEGLKLNYPKVTDDKIIVLHPGINLDKWPMREHHEPGDRFKILFVGGDNERKGLPTLLDAFEQTLQHTCEMHIATHSGYLSPAMKERIERIPHTHLYLDLTSSSEELQRLYRESDVFVLPTNQDCSPWVAIEALSTGIPLVITSVGGIPDIVKDRETGLVVPPREPAQLAAAVECLRQSPELTKKLIRQGREHVEANFDAKINTGKFLHEIKRTILARQMQR